MRRRTQERAEFRAKKKEAAKLRRERDRCPHGDDERIFATHAEADADESPPVICDICGKQKLAVGVVNPAYAKPEVAATAKVENILR